MQQPTTTDLRAPASAPAPAAGGLAGARASASVDAAVRGLGYELVDVERAPGGLLRVTIDTPWIPGQAPDAHRAVNVDDCEKVTRQLQHVLEVEGTNYQRLEVSSPGLDRPLRSTADFERFLGHAVEVTLKAPFQGRKRWKGELQRGEADGWRLVLLPEAAPKGKPGKPIGKPNKQRAAEAPAADAATDTVLDFALPEVREARLVPVIDFKGRRQAAPADTGSEPGVAQDGGREE